MQQFYREKTKKENYVSCMRKAKLTGRTVSACRLAASPWIRTRSIWGTSEKRLREGEDAGSLGLAGMCSSSALRGYRLVWSVRGCLGMGTVDGLAQELIHTWQPGYRYILWLPSKHEKANLSYPIPYTTVA
jgi:hypothetical protein